jgi:hypothetical protein
VIERPFAWNNWGLFGLVPLVVCATMAAFVLVTRPGRTQNRRLSLLLLLEGVTTFGAPPGAALAGSRATADVLFHIHFVGLFLLVPIILRFLATIDTPFTRPLVTRAGGVGPWLLAVAGTVLVFARPGLFFRGLREPWWGGWMFDPGVLATVAYALPAVVLTYSLVVAISAYRRAAPGTPTRERARRYAIAFGFNDGLTILVTTVVPFIYGASGHSDLRPIEFMFVWAIPIIETVFVGLMAYGILRAQLFDIDLRIAAGLRRGAIGVIVLFVFLTAAELADRFVSEEFGYVIGAFVAAALLVAHKPIEELAAVLTRAVLPGVEPSQAYLTFRKLEVYMEAVEAAYEDGDLSAGDRVILNRLQAKLGVAPADAARLENDAERARVETVLREAVPTD